MRAEEVFIYLGSSQQSLDNRGRGVFFPAGNSRTQMMSDSGTLLTNQDLALSATVPVDDELFRLGELYVQLCKVSVQLCKGGRGGWFLYSRGLPRTSVNLA